MFSELIRSFSALSSLQLALLALAAVTWLGGGNILVAYHYKRLGKSPWSGFKPFAFPFTRFNAKEWLILGGLAILALIFAGLSLSISPQ